MEELVGLGVLLHGEVHNVIGCIETFQIPKAHLPFMTRYNVMFVHNKIKTGAPKEPPVLYTITVLSFATLVKY